MQVNVAPGHLQKIKKKLSSHPLKKERTCIEKMAVEELDLDLAL
jgi:hypothetical protein